VSALDHIDRQLGQATEWAVAAHHRRRLARLGHSGSYNPPGDGTLWCAGEPAPRDGCSLEVLIDGAQALPRIAAAIEGATSSVHIAGWHMTPDFGLTRDATARPLRDLLGAVAERADVRVLLWAGSPAPVF
jgi:phosphatidylserine/phosphatidylglycerophosphate/cardiolipin synthase-like enzyme